MNTILVTYKEIIVVEPQIYIKILVPAFSNQNAVIEFLFNHSIRNAVNPFLQTIQDKSIFNPLLYIQIFEPLET